MPNIELRLSEKDPPAADLPKTIFRDAYNLPSTVKLGITIRYFNNTAGALYFQMTGSGTGYTFGTVNMGSLGANSSAYRNLDDFATRSKPADGDFTAGEFEEKVTLTLKAYTDAGYSNLYDTFSRDVTVHWIKSNDAAFTQDFLDNFDDGTVDGWASRALGGDFGGTRTLAVATDQILSPPYSLKLTYQGRWCYTGSGCGTWGKFKEDLQADTVLIHVGRQHDTVETDYIPRVKWIRQVVPLPKNSTFEVKVRLDLTVKDPVYDYWRYYFELYKSFTTPNRDKVYAIVDVRLDWTQSYSSGYGYAYVWMDDFKIISK